MKITVTGSSGFVAPCSITALREPGHCILGMDRVPSDDVELDELVEQDLIEPLVVSRAIHDVDGLIHLAAVKDDWGNFPEEFRRENVGVTRTLLSRAHKVPLRFHLFYSIVSAIRPRVEAVGKKANLEPVNPYGKSEA